MKTATTAPHRHKIRIQGHDGAYHACCPCGVRGPAYHTVSEAYTHHKADFLEVTALRAAEAAKAEGQTQHYLAVTAPLALVDAEAEYRAAFAKLPPGEQHAARIDMIRDGESFIQVKGDKARRIDPSEVRA